MEALKDGHPGLHQRGNCWKPAFAAAAETALGIMAEAKAARVNDRLKHRERERGKEEGGQEETVWVLHIINNFRMCTEMPVGLCATVLSCWYVNTAVL